jgi:hypothetical protein
MKRQQAIEPQCLYMQTSDRDANIVAVAVWHGDIDV